MDLDNKNIKKSIFKAQFNSLEINIEDPTILRGKIIIHDFEPSYNKQCITEEICSENMNTLIGKRIVCRYISSEDNNGMDALSSHEEDISNDRDNGNEIIITNTIAIGFIENVYIDDYTDNDGNVKRVLFGEVLIWNDDKYKNIVGLLQEWINRGIKIHMSVEYLYCNYNLLDGIEYLQSPILYVAHTLLNSEQRQDVAEVLPAYDCATLISLNERTKWNKAINQISKSENNINSDLNINNNSPKEENNNMTENKFYKALCELSYGDTKEQIMTALSKLMSADTFYSVWLSNYGIYSTYFIYETYVDSKYVNFKVPYTKTETEVIVDLASQVQVERDTIWVEVGVMQEQVASLNAKVEEIQTSLNTKEVELVTATETIIELQTQLNSKEETIQALNSKVEVTTEEKNVTMEKFNELAETVTSLNTQVKVLQPLADSYNTEQYEKALNSAKEFYKEKFENVDAIDVFEKEETQELIKKSINSVDDIEVKNAKFSLNDLIINNLKPNEVKMGISLNSIQIAKETKNLNDFTDEFEATYGFKRD
jgi:hypothetical protein